MTSTHVCILCMRHAQDVASVAWFLEAAICSMRPLKQCFYANPYISLVEHILGIFKDPVYLFVFFVVCGTAHSAIVILRMSVCTGSNVAYKDLRPESVSLEKRACILDSGLRCILSGLCLSA